MRITKALGLAAIAAVATMAFVGTGSAFAQHEIVFCKELVALCPAGKLWPQGTKVLFLAPGKGAEPSTLLGTLNVKCEDSLGSAEVTSAGGIGSPLAVSINVEFGVLPTPTLGKGCTSCTEVHVGNPIAGQVEVAGVDEYFLKTTFKLATLCPFIGTCTFEGKNIKVPILHTGEHPKHPGTNLALIEFKAVALTRTEGPALCGSEIKWDADYVVYLADPPAGESGLAWPSLDKKV